MATFLQFLILCSSGKDIEIALTEIQELQMKLGNLTEENYNFKTQISFLEHENKKLNRFRTNLIRTFNN